MSDRNKPWAFLTESSTDLSRWLSALAKVAVPILCCCLSRLEWYVLQAICDASGMYSTAPRVGSKVCSLVRSLRLEYLIPKYLNRTLNSEERYFFDMAQMGYVLCIELFPVYLLIVFS